MTEERTERYRIEIDINQAFQSYTSLIELSSKWNQAVGATAEGLRKVEGAEAKLNSISVGNSKERVKATKELVSAQKELSAAYKGLTSLDKELQAEAKKRFGLSRIDLSARKKGSKHS